MKYGVNMKIEHILPENIEKRSFEIIGEELESRGIVLPEDRDFVIKRAIHTTADFDYAQSLVFSENAVNILADLIKSGATIVTDTKSLLKYGCNVECFMADEDVAKEAARRGVTRASVSMERAAKLSGKVIFVVGNAPTALISLYDMYKEGSFIPDFIIGVPVGFVNVVAAKELIIESGVDCIVARGRKGGSNVAAAIVNALMYQAVNRDEL